MELVQEGVPGLDMDPTKLGSHLTELVQEGVLKHVLEGGTFGLGEELLDIDVVGLGQGGQPLQPGIVGGREDCEGERRIVQVACKIIHC